MKGEKKSPRFSRRSVLVGIAVGAVSPSIRAEEIPKKTIDEAAADACLIYGSQVEEVLSTDQAKASFERMVKSIEEAVFAPHFKETLASINIYHGDRKLYTCQNPDELIYGSYFKIDNSIALAPREYSLDFIKTAVHEFLHALEMANLISVEDFMVAYNLTKDNLTKQRESGSELLDYYLQKEKMLRSHYEESLMAQQTELMIRVLVDGLFEEQPMTESLVNFYSPLLKAPALLTNLPERLSFAQSLAEKVSKDYKIIKNL